MSTLSVIVVTFNEAHNIARCLSSVKDLANEIIVYDSSSTDKTVEIAKTLTPHVFVTEDWPGDGQQKNRALTKVTSRWVLCLDADEALTPAGCEEIKQAIKNTAIAAYDLPFQSYYLGRPMRFGHWRNEWHIRLFQHSKAKFTDSIVHCHLKIDGKVGKLKEKVQHLSVQSLHNMLVKMNDYSTGGAKIRFENNKRASFLSALGHGLWNFIHGYFIKLGFLDGREGLMLALANAEGTYYRYLKMMCLCEGKAIE